MTDREPEDDDLTPILKAWRVEEAPAAVERRVLEAFRSARPATPPFWRRAFSTSVRVPVPLLAGLVLVCLTSLGLLLRGSPPKPSEGEPSSAGPGAPAIVAPASDRNAGLLGFEPIREPKLVVVDKGMQP